MSMKKRKVYVLRIGHRPSRDKRISTHVGLVARAFGADGIIYSNTNDRGLYQSLMKVVETWGGPFEVKLGGHWRQIIKDWKDRGGVVIHLTMYGENIEQSDILRKLRELEKDVLVVVGAEKVPGEVYDLADFNIAIGNQPHSEVAALAIFLDRLFEGRELTKEFKNAKLKIIPQIRGKKVVKIG
ncbi:MAG: tRNA (cytidine(56)-2'-O)-methyltransferase [Thermoprotei archaeon]|nr:MAG: tRNA (cytidine(56)-2'-O)-methyltransferase [Thermoprotei archaeon]RLF03279.1 MAG: tRNA (cytidine(56)-2'-O)-methyltransferase [Thermoprotei archaeon]